MNYCLLYFLNRVLFCWGLEQFLITFFMLGEMNCHWRDYFTK